MQMEVTLYMLSLSFLCFTFIGFWLWSVTTLFKEILFLFYFYFLLLPKLRIKEYQQWELCPTIQMDVWYIY